MLVGNTVTFENKDADLFYHNKCDKYDLMVSVGCGTIGGLIDVFLVGAPGDSILGKWTDAQVDKCVMAFSKLCGWSPRKGKEGSTASAIGYLEKKFGVNYDQRHSADVDYTFYMSTKNHHMKSLGHSPDIIGLFFSLLSQFTSNSYFLSDGKLYAIKSDQMILKGDNIVSKLFFGTVNWLGHLMSDVAGSSGGRAKNTGRGSGIVMPFYELFQKCNFGKFQVGDDRQTIATIATRAFQSGYDFRHGLTMSIPVVLTDLLIRFFWTIKRHFYHNIPLKECIPTRRYKNLRTMLIVGNGAICVIDGIDAGIRCGGNALIFFTRLNLIAWYRQTMLTLKEVFIRLGISADMDLYLESYLIINQHLREYLDELEKIDIDKYRQETEVYNNFIAELNDADSEKALNVLLRNEFTRAGLKLPWNGDFDDFMSDKQNILEFK